MKPAVVGRQLFVDLWAMEGFEPIVCESPSDLATMLKTLTDDERPFVVVEDRWFRCVPASLRKRLTASQNPVWISFPDLFAEPS
jgi:hypothetical protein